MYQRKVPAHELPHAFEITAPLDATAPAPEDHLLEGELAEEHLRFCSVFPGEPDRILLDRGECKAMQTKEQGSNATSHAVTTSSIH